MLDTETDPLIREWYANAPPPIEPKKRVGRPKGGHNVLIDWVAAEKLYVEGELDGLGVRRYLTRGAMALRAGTTASNLDQRILRYDWATKRAEYKAKNGIGVNDTPDASRQRAKQKETDIAIIEGSADKLTKPGKKGKREPLAILERYIAQFAEAIDKRRVRFDTIKDFEIAVRLRAFVMGQAESIKQTHTTVSLEIMQARHKQARAYVATTVDDAVAGVLGRHVPAAIDAEFVEVSPEHEGTPEPAPVSAVPVDEWGFGTSASAEKRT